MQGEEFFSEIENFGQEKGQVIYQISIRFQTVGPRDRQNRVDTKKGRDKFRAVKNVIFFLKRSFENLVREIFSSPKLGAKSSPMLSLI